MAHNHFSNLVNLINWPRSDTSPPLSLPLTLLFSALTDTALSTISSDCKVSSIKTQTYGWNILGGSIIYTLADYLENSRTPKDVILMPDIIYNYVYNLAYGVGFASPFLLPTYLGSCSIDCSSADFTALAGRYGLTYGLAGQNIGESKIRNFGLDAKQALGCMLQQKGSSKEAAQVDYLIDDLVDAGVQMIKLQKKLTYLSKLCN